MTPLKSADLDSADDRFRGTVRGLLLLDGKLSSRAISREKALFDWIGYRIGFEGKGVEASLRDQRRMKGSSSSWARNRRIEEVYLFFVKGRTNEALFGLLFASFRITAFHVRRMLVDYLLS